MTAFSQGYIKKVGGVVVLIPKDADPWRPFLDRLDKFSDGFRDFEQNQGSFEHREALTWDRS